MKPRAANLPQAFDESSAYPSPERRLMMAIIVAAIQDAIGCSAANDCPDERARQKGIARQWFEDNSRDFQIVCLEAGLEPEAVRTAAIAYIEAETIAGPKRARPKKDADDKPKHIVKYRVADLEVIALRAGLSVSSVSRVLYGAANPGAATVEAVHTAMRALSVEREAA